jgi:uncharacterized membrane protein YdbT with pleckstrin-like domain
MSYIDDNLKENEHVVYRTKLHWATLLGPAMLLIIGGLSIPSKGMSGLILFGLGLLWGILSSISYQTSEIGITDRRLLIRIGFPVRRTYDIALTTIEMVDTYQPSLGKLLNFGKVILGLDGRKRGAFRMIDSPLDFRAQLEKQVFAVLKQEEEAKK